MPLTPGSTININDDGQIPKPGIEITPLYDDAEDNNVNSILNTDESVESNIMLEPLHIKNNRVRNSTFCIQKTAKCVLEK